MSARRKERQGGAGAGGGAGHMADSGLSDWWRRAGAASQARRAGNVIQGGPSEDDVPGSRSICSQSLQRRAGCRGGSRG